MTVQTIDSTVTFRIESPSRFSSSWRSEQENTIVQASQMTDIPHQELLRYISSSAGDSSVVDDRQALSRQTMRNSAEGNLPVFRPERQVQSVERFACLQKWEGVVLEIRNSCFVARLVDLSRSNPDEEAEFDIEDVPEADRLLIAPGAIFYWNLGYLDSRHGQRYRASLIRFRRLPAWTEEEIERAREEAKRIADALGWK